MANEGSPGERSTSTSTSAESRPTTAQLSVLASRAPLRQTIVVIVSRAHRACSPLCHAASCRAIAFSAERSQPRRRSSSSCQVRSGLAAVFPVTSRNSSMACTRSSAHEDEYQVSVGKPRLIYLKVLTVLSRIPAPYRRKVQSRRAAEHTTLDPAKQTHTTRETGNESPSTLDTHQRRVPLRVARRQNLRRGSDHGSHRATNQTARFTIDGHCGTARHALGGPVVSMKYTVLVPFESDPLVR